MRHKISFSMVLSGSARAGRVFVLALAATGLLLSVQAKKAPCVVPPMGWNSYNCWNYGVTERQFMENAHYLANLKEYGWEYVVVDFIWWIPVSCAGCGNQSGDWNKGNLDQYGRFLPDTTRFPSAKGGRGFKPLGDSVHNLGLKFGIHLMRGVPRMAVRRNCPVYNSTYTCTDAAEQTSTCPWLDWMYGAKNNAAGQAYLTSMVQLCNDWGCDYLKIDDLSAATYHGPEVEMYAKAIASVSREIVFSTSPGATPLNQANHVSQYCNMWRLVNDLWDTWWQLVDAYNVDESWRKTTVQWGAEKGMWPDIDMLPFGHLALNGPVGQPRYSLGNNTYTKGEHRLMFLLWCVNNGPLMWGGNLPDNSKDPVDPKFYDSIMTNRDALFINQHGTKVMVLIEQSTGTPIWTSTHPLDTTTKFVLLGNTSGSNQTISLNLTTIGFPANQSVPVKNIWTGAKLNNFTGTFAQTIPTHDAGLYALGDAPLVWDSDAVRPAQSVEKPAMAAAGSVFPVSGDRIVIPKVYAGKTVRISVFNLDGRLLHSAVTRDRPVTLFNGKGSAEKISIVKINEIR